jgi:hypothetical protein
MQVGIDAYSWLHKGGMHLPPRDGSRILKFIQSDSPLSWGLLRLLLGFVPCKRVKIHLLAPFITVWYQPPL